MNIKIFKRKIGHLDITQGTVLNFKVLCFDHMQQIGNKKRRSFSTGKTSKKRQEGIEPGTSGSRRQSFTK